LEALDSLGRRGKRMGSRPAEQVCVKKRSAVRVRKKNATQFVWILRGGGGAAGEVLGSLVKEGSRAEGLSGLGDRVSRGTVRPIHHLFGGGERGPGGSKKDFAVWQRGVALLGV